MFQPGTVVKVKVETSPGEMGFGRATIIDRTGSQLLIQVRTSRETNKILPKGTRVWFVNDSPRLTFNGMWAANVLGTQVSKGRTVLVCSAPKLEPLSQRRRAQRVNVEMPVTISLNIDGHQKQEFRTVDLCKSGSAIETTRIDQLEVESGKEINAVLHTSEGDVTLTARILRVDHNWLANKTTLALEFIALSQESSAILDKVLVRIGGKPRDAELDREHGGAAGREGMTSWIKQVKKTPAPDSFGDQELNESSDEFGVVGEGDYVVEDAEETI
ncbi:PilZ domain-containing protein [Candidatus Obscuribacterales bacterium]|nr:PilZ domain-containing protein [Candidatus Obscuribacterales bacterium]MBX3153679.1 PilZ domain-containing protein [Candidatus Obscuribacterales bacterium]